MEMERHGDTFGHGETGVRPRQELRVIERWGDDKSGRRTQGDGDMKIWRYGETGDRGRPYG